MQNVLSYVQTFEEDYAVCLVYVCIIDVMQDMTSSDFLVTTSKLNYIHYIRI